MGETRERHQKKKKKDGKQPLASSGESVPRWERDFCTAECSIPWKKIREAKQAIQIYDKVANWDDSGAREAFETARSRYFARRFGKQPCGALTDTKPVEGRDKRSDEEEQTEMNCTLESFLLAHHESTAPISIVWEIPENPVSWLEIKARPVQEGNPFGHYSCLARKRNDECCCNGSMQEGSRRRRRCRRGDQRTSRKKSQQTITCLHPCSFFWQKKNKNKLKSSASVISSSGSC